MGRQVRELLDSYSAESLKIHEAFLKAERTSGVHVMSLPRAWHCACLLVYPQIRGLLSKTPPPWFTQEWKDAERKGGHGEDPTPSTLLEGGDCCLDGKSLKARYNRVGAIHKAEGLNVSTQKGLLDEIEKADESMVLKKETLQAKQKSITNGYLKRLGRLQAVREAGPKPEPTSADTSIKQASSYAQMVQWKVNKVRPRRSRPLLRRVTLVLFSPKQLVNQPLLT